MKTSFHILTRLVSLCACICLSASLARPAQADPATGVYRLTTRGQQGMCLDVEGWGNGSGTGVSLYPANKTSNQQWLVERQDDGAYKIYAFSGQNSLQMLDAANGLTANGTPVKTWEDNGNDAQRWYFQSVGGGLYGFGDNDHHGQSPDRRGDGKNQRHGGGRDGGQFGPLHRAALTPPRFALK